MKLYRVSLITEAGGAKTAKWVGSQDEATKQRMALMDAFGLKRKDVHIGQIDVPTTKADLIEWLNAKGV
jgi:hypothetical protein